MTFPISYVNKLLDLWHKNENTKIHYNTLLLFQHLTFQPMNAQI